MEKVSNSQYGFFGLCGVCRPGLQNERIGIPAPQLSIAI
jgi:hypothetical protein